VEANAEGCWENAEGVGCENAEGVGCENAEVVGWENADVEGFVNAEGAENAEGVVVDPWPLDPRLKADAGIAPNGDDPNEEGLENDDVAAGAPNAFVVEPCPKAKVVSPPNALTPPKELVVPSVFPAG
jgi:hypothetical protein